VSCWCGKTLCEGSGRRPRDRGEEGLRIHRIIQGGDSEECLGMGPLVFGGIVEMFVADVPLCPSRGLEQLGPGSN
jgi:hypothetical protein